MTGISRITIYEKPGIKIAMGLETKYFRLGRKIGCFQMGRKCNWSRSVRKGDQLCQRIWGSSDNTWDSMGKMQLLTLGNRQEKKCDHNILDDSARNSISIAMMM